MRWRSQTICNVSAASLRSQWRLFCIAENLGFIGSLLALSVVTRSMNPTATSQPQASPAQAAPSHTARPNSTSGAGCTSCRDPEDGPWNAACNYFALATGGGWTAGTLATIRSLRWSCDLKKVDFLIATVPDPQTTHLALYFDRTLESLAWALGDADYVFQNSWLPWSQVPAQGLAQLSDLDCDRKRRIN